jgi:hypothetical protein
MYDMHRPALVLDGIERAYCGALRARTTAAVPSPASAARVFAATSASAHGGPIAAARALSDRDKAHGLITWYAPMKQVKNPAQRTGLTPRGLRMV